MLKTWLKQIKIKNQKGFAEILLIVVGTLIVSGIAAGVLYFKSVLQVLVWKS